MPRHKEDKNMKMVLKEDVPIGKLAGISFWQRFSLTSLLVAYMAISLKRN